MHNGDCVKSEQRIPNGKCRTDSDCGDNENCDDEHYSPPHFECYLPSEKTFPNPYCKKQGNDECLGQYLSLEARDYGSSNYIEIPGLYHTCLGDTISSHDEYLCALTGSVYYYEHINNYIIDNGGTVTEKFNPLKSENFKTFMSQENKFTYSYFMFLVNSNHESNRWRDAKVKLKTCSYEDCSPSTSVNPNEYPRYVQEALCNRYSYAIDGRWNIATTDCKAPCATKDIPEVFGTCTTVSCSNDQHIEINNQGKKFCTSNTRTCKHGGKEHRKDGKRDGQCVCSRNEECSGNALCKGSVIGQAHSDCILLSDQYETYINSKCIQVAKNWDWNTNGGTSYYDIKERRYLYTNNTIQAECINSVNRPNCIGEKCIDEEEKLIRSNKQACERIGGTSDYRQAKRGVCKTCEGDECFVKKTDSIYYGFKIYSRKTIDSSSPNCPAGYTKMKAYKYVPAFLNFTSAVRTVSCYKPLDTLVYSDFPHHYQLGDNCIMSTPASTSDTSQSWYIWKNIELGTVQWKQNSLVCKPNGKKQTLAFDINCDDTTQILISWNEKNGKIRHTNKHNQTIKERCGQAISEN